MTDNIKIINVKQLKKRKEVIELLGFKQVTNGYYQHPRLTSDINMINIYCSSFSDEQVFEVIFHDGELLGKQDKMNEFKHVLGIWEYDDKNENEKEINSYEK